MINFILGVSVCMNIFLLTIISVYVSIKKRQMEEGGSDDSIEDKKQAFDFFGRI